MRLPRLAVPETRSAPDDLVRRLRRVDPDAALVYSGAGRWWLGTLTLPEPRRAAARYLVAQLTSAPLPLEPEARRAAEAQRGYKVHLARCAAEGFDHIASFDIQGEPDARILADLEDRTWGLEHEADARVERALAVASGDVRRAAHLGQVLEHARMTYRDAHRHAIRKPVSVAVTHGPVMSTYTPSSLP